MVPSLERKAAKTEASDSPASAPSIFDKRPKPISKPAGILSSSGRKLAANERFSVQDALTAPTESKEDPLAQDDSVPIGEVKTKPIVEAEFMKLWKELAEELKNEDMSLYTAMTLQKPVLEGEKVHLLLNNTTQEERLGNWRIHLVTRLRETLENTSIDIIAKVNREEAKVEKLATQKQKYETMKEKNPALEKLRINLNLDLDM